MAKSVTDYLRMLQALLPLGKAWNRDPDSTMTEVLTAQADEFVRLDTRSDDLRRERDTRFASELLVDHETDLGLPDECSELSPTITTRRREAHSRLITLGQQNPAYFIELAEALGWTVTITEYTPFWMAVGAMGDPVGDQEVIFYWKVTIAYGGGDIIYFTTGNSEIGDPLSYIPGTDTLICILNKFKPGHTTLIWDYDGPEYSNAFSNAFDALPVTDTDLTGAFAQAFGLSFDVALGGAYDNSFDINFNKPS